MKKLTNLLILNLVLFSFVYAQTITDPNDFRQYIRRSHKLQNEGKQVEAIKILTEAINKFPNESALYFERAKFYRQLKKYELLDNDLNEAVRLSIDKYNAYIHAGVIFSSIRECDKALNFYNAAINLKADDSMAYINRATTQGYCFQNKSEALNDVNYALAVDPENIHARSLRNRLLAEIGNQKPNVDTNKDLIISLEQKLEISPKDERIKRELSMLYINRSRMFEKEKKTEEMFADLTRAIEVYPEFHTYCLRAKKLSQYKFYDEAIKDYTEAIEYQPLSWITYLERGDIYHKLNQFENALKDYNKALTLELASERLLNRQIKRTKQKMQTLNQ